MNWFKGEISEAVANSKAKHAIFVVYVEGQNEKSSQITNQINEAEISGVLGSEKFVAIKIEAESVPYQQFSQIYTQPPIPSIYFIGKTGSPLEILTEPAHLTLDKLNSILLKAGLTPNAQQSADLINSEKLTSTEPPPSANCQDGVCTIEKTPETSATSETDQRKDVPTPTPEEKVERAKELVERKRLEKEREEKEAEKLKEIERRKMGQEVQQLKKWQDEQELKNLLEERQKEKREGQAARERVLAQIAQDKVERAAKSSPPASGSPPPAPRSSPKPASSNVARLQFRLPDGSTATRDFGSAEPLDAVHTHIRNNLSLTFTNYTLSTTFPRREFTENDKSQSLADLGLVPTAVLLILPMNRGTVSTNPSGGGGFTAMVWSLLAPLFGILGYLKGMIFGGEAQKRPAPGSPTPDQRPQTSKMPRRSPGESTVVRKQGNVHGLSSKTDSDDENNTWNGNSTQQM